MIIKVEKKMMEYLEIMHEVIGVDSGDKLKKFKRKAYSKDQTGEHV